MNAITPEVVLDMIPVGSLSFETITTRLAEIDVGAVRIEQQPRVRWELWDKVAPINGVVASQVLERADMLAADAVYMIYIDDRLVFLQPHLPSAGQVPMSQEVALEAASAQAEEIVDRLTFGAVVAQVTFDVQRRRRP